MTGELISVIVPVYNVAPYLDRCIKSIVDQTYKNLEVILVDDGSTDASGDVCDSWAKRDSRIRVIHKPNGGQSEARNAGIELSTGNYLSFADPDDWLDISMLETLYTAIRNNQGVDLAVCDFVMVFDDKAKRRPCSGKTYTLTSDEAIHDVVYGRRPVSSASVCNKLYARHLWDTIRFPVGTYFEDAYVRSRMYAKCEKIAVVDHDLYFYYQRKDSAMHLMNVGTRIDGVNILLQECEFLCGQYPHLRSAASVMVLKAIEAVYILKMEKNGSMPPEMDQYLRTVFTQYKRGTRKHLPPYNRLKYALFSISPSLMCAAVRIWRSILRLKKRLKRWISPRKPFYERAQCCGCFACKDACPQNAITMRMDKEGFCYPKIDQKLCVKCGGCEKVCPWKGEENTEEFRKYFGVQAKEDALRRTSTSGGVFPVLAEHILRLGGVIYGAGFDSSMRLTHQRADDREKLVRLIQTKYIQSDLAGVYQMIRYDLRNRRNVLFAGTPCQTEAVRKLFGTACPQLILVDLVCYGVPSPGIWEDYVRYLEKKHGGKLNAFYFRDKRNRNNGHTISYQVDSREFVNDYSKDPFMAMFNSNCILRPSCHECKFSAAPRNSDITIGDFWGIEKTDPAMDDGMGTSLVIFHTHKAAQLWDAVQDRFHYIECAEDEALQPRLISPTTASKKRGLFFKLYRKIPFRLLVLSFGNRRLLRRIWRMK